MQSQRRPQGPSTVYPRVLRPGQKQQFPDSICCMKGHRVLGDEKVLAGEDPMVTDRREVVLILSVLARRSRQKTSTGGGSRRVELDGLQRCELFHVMVDF